MNAPTAKQIHLYRSLFRGRDDVYAVRWKKAGKSGYTPAFHFDPYRYRMHKARGGTFQNYTEKEYQPLSDEQVAKHLAGEQLIGLYPLLKDNTSWFIAADFDEAKWVDERRKFLKACTDHGLPAYLERSRSGKGGHVWIFFDQPYPASRSRKIVIALLEQAGLFSKFDKSSSFDRLFPNQDFLSGKGLGNLIGLPLHKESLTQGNSCFIDPVNLVPYPDQWSFLENIKRATKEPLDGLYETVRKATEDFQPALSSSGKLVVRLDNTIRISRGNIPGKLVDFLKEEFNFSNSEYFIKKKTGRNTFGTQRFFKCIEETESEIIVPRGAIGKLLRFCKEQDIGHDFIDERKRKEITTYSLNVYFCEHQQAALSAASRKDLGVIVAPPGSGKTVTALGIIAAKQQPALIIVHRKQLAEQWIERIQAFLGIRDMK